MGNNPDCYVCGAQADVQFSMDLEKYLNERIQNRKQV